MLLRPRRRGRHRRAPGRGRPAGTWRDGADHDVRLARPLRARSEHGRVSRRHLVFRVSRRCRRVVGDHSGRVASWSVSSTTMRRAPRGDRAESRRFVEGMRAKDASGALPDPLQQTIRDPGEPGDPVRDRARCFHRRGQRRRRPGCRSTHRRGSARHRDAAERADRDAPAGQARKRVHEHADRCASISLQEDELRARRSCTRRTCGTRGRG